MPGRGATSAEIMAWLRERLPDDAIITNGAGNYAAGCTASTATAGCARSSAPTSGAMGYGVPAAVAAKLVHPERTSSRSPATAAS